MQNQILWNLFSFSIDKIIIKLMTIPDAVSQVLSILFIKLNIVVIIRPFTTMNEFPYAMLKKSRFLCWTMSENLGWKLVEEFGYWTANGLSRLLVFLLKRM